MERSPQVGIRNIAADDEGLVVPVRTTDDDNDPNQPVALSPTGKSKKDLGTIQDGASTVKLAGDKVYVGTGMGEVLVANRGTGGLQKLAVDRPSSILAKGNDLFVTDKEHGECYQAEEGMACPFDGKAFRIAF